MKDFAHPERRGTLLGAVYPPQDHSFEEQPSPYWRYLTPIMPSIETATGQLATASVFNLEKVPDLPQVMAMPW